MSDKLDIKRIQSDRGALVRLLEGAGALFKGNNCNCPFHDDKSPSASIHEKEGAWRFKCHTPACGVSGDILDMQAKLNGRSLGDELRAISKEEESKATPPRVFPTIEAMLLSVAAYTTVEDHYRYTDPDTGDVDMLVIRCRASTGKKSFLQAKPVPDGFVMKGPNKPWPLFNRTILRSTTTCIIVEGEKCVKALRSIGWIATTSPGGAENANNADWTPLAGMTCYIWRDFDEAGLCYAKDVAAQLAKLVPPATACMVDVAELNLPEKSDVVQFLQEYGGPTNETKYEAVKSILSLSEPATPSASVRKLIEDTISGKRQAIEWPWAGLGKLTNALLPGTTTALCGDPGASKSFMLLEAARSWHQNQIPFAMYQLEADEDGSHILRAIVQHTGEADLWDWRWIRDNPDAARNIEKGCRDFTDSFGKSLWVPPATPPSLKDLTDWVRDRAKEGRRIIAIDPISAADTSDQRWNDDRHFILNTQAIMRAHSASLVIVTHPKLNAKNGTMAEVAGGAAYTRFTHTVLWLKMHEPAKEVSISDQFGSQITVEANRTLKISKARLGRGTGFELAYKFGGGMVFKELGPVAKKVKDNPDE